MTNNTNAKTLEVVSETSKCIKLTIADGLATVAIDNGKLNAINENLLDELSSCFHTLSSNPEVKAVVWTGKGKFFSFGFDVQALISYPKESFQRFVEKFYSLCSYLFLYPKPIVGALNGHAVAGGCVFSLVCDYRVMAAGKTRIGLNEITFGSTLPSCAVEMLR